MDAPCTILPDELVCEIFMHFVPTYPLCPPLTGPESPTTLTHVCREWRAIALATPKLWQAISLRFADAGKVETVRTWLDRSGTNPLSIQMETNNGYNHAWLSGDIVGALFLHRDRWEHVKLVLLDSELALIALPMPMLDSLSLEIDKGISDGGFPRGIPRVDCPRLRVLSLCGFRVAVDWLPWSRITSLALRYMYGVNYISALQDSVNLIDLRMIDCGGDTLTPRRDVLLPRLETLIMAHTMPFSQNLSIYILPAVHTLQVPGSYLGYRPIDFFASFIHKSGCRLQKVFITGSFRSNQSETDFQGAFPSIPTITFDKEYRWGGGGEE
ncbi:hypothetical protein FB45DRAFT_1053765 [Roridomyces roridus]|uniref:F-box domain-containing protein n=1 Tax=Roridomyces roridus TaxID=1738132 RepID=A0AAD7C7Q0_9AGAR|nr:hypothetical protein FB45DRAFT_1053765 [Roridomyces roridus]